MNYCFNTYPGAELWETARDRGGEVVLAKILKREKGGGEKQERVNNRCVCVRVDTYVQFSFIPIKKPWKYSCCLISHLIEHTETYM